MISLTVQTFDELRSGSVVPATRTDP